MSTLTNNWYCHISTRITSRITSRIGSWTSTWNLSINILFNNDFSSSRSININHITTRITPWTSAWASTWNLSVNIFFDNYFISSRSIYVNHITTWITTRYRINWTDRNYRIHVRIVRFIVTSTIKWNFLNKRFYNFLSYSCRSWCRTRNVWWRWSETGIILIRSWKRTIIIVAIIITAKVITATIIKITKIKPIKWIIRLREKRWLRSKWWSKWWSKRWDKRRISTGTTVMVVSS